MDVIVSMSQVMWNSGLPAGIFHGIKRHRSVTHEQKSTSKPQFFTFTLRNYENRISVHNKERYGYPYE